jgi:hypothetical protein
LPEENKKLMKKLLVFIFLQIFIIQVSSVSAHWEFHDRDGKYLFGYAGVGDNPELYMPEIENNRIPTNVQSITVNTPLDDLRPKIEYLAARGQKVIIVLDNLLFRKDANLATPCGEFAVRPWLNYGTRFDDWLRINQNAVNSERVAALVINTEVNNRCITYNALDQVTKYVNGKTPSVPTVAGYGHSSGAMPLPEAVPASLAGVLFFKYVVLYPATDGEYQTDFQLLKSKLTPGQRIILVPDGFYSPSHAAAGWAKWHLGYLALNYADFAKNDDKVVGLVFFLWASFGDNLGMRDLPQNVPQNVRDRHRSAACALGIDSLQNGFCAN